MSCGSCNAQGTTYNASFKPEDYAACSGFPLRIDRSTAEKYAYRVDTPKSGVRGGPMCLVVSSLMVGRLIYWKQKPGDCGTKTSINLGASVPIAKGLGLAGSLSGGVGSGLGAFGAGGAIAGVATAAATVIGLVGIPIAVWASMSAHHKAAVAKEQATLCEVVVAFNNACDVWEAAMAAGQLAPDDARQAVFQLEPVLLSYTKQIKKTCNAACEMEYALRAIDLYNTEVFYPALKKPAVMTQLKSSRNVGVAAVIAAGAALVA